MQKYISLLLLSCLMVLHAAGQLRYITGTVQDSLTHNGIPNAVVRVKGSDILTATNAQGHFRLQVPGGKQLLEANRAGYTGQTIGISSQQTTVHFQLRMLQPLLKEREQNRIVMEASQDSQVYGSRAISNGALMMTKKMSPSPYPHTPVYNTEDYSPINENIFHTATDQPLSTFSIDVDRASYSNMRRFLNNGELPPADAVRVEELINYFDYRYQPPTGKDPVAFYTDMAVCPWDTKHQLVRIALKSKEVDTKDLPPANLVFLIDVSGSMDAPNKLPLVKRAFKVLADQLRPQDKVAIVVYAGAAGTVLPATSGAEKSKILEALDNLQAGGSTAGGEGIRLAYRIAGENKQKNSNNRVILATDGDFNVGASSDGELEKLITRERQQGIQLSVLGFGMGNYKDNKLELLADKGNGNYAYIDNFEEARRTFVTAFGGTLFTVAGDVKLQVEFNPTFVQAYRLVGYENRVLQNEDFNNDQKDAGDMGVGHTVTALYEIIPTGKGTPAVSWVDPLKYQQGKPIGNTTEVLTVKMRYKLPGETSSRLLQQVLPYRHQVITQMPADFRMAAAAAAFGQLLRQSPFKGTATYSDVLNWAGTARGDDPEGYRAEFLQLVKKAALLDKE
ncbi:YfbK domain-containing protein [Chitinophaga nivalis]|uniref:von Willebrand factor type A domain-containing protein n=1 Tax=Chitinophaga nivalis TaxID=2991709 RepID=A0ABT3IWJ9_9BACT|nr:von Willebrand factor type A domain-containing protein [Chitinophaga nivalis]MCW3461953.1 von Willebrand factor type A domain-containing protein [Chitinophaga nivalis]MCW3488356.1 von Willebrand factor type A domain-containing protein [Chitinophaga nivalis]